MYHKNLQAYKKQNLQADLSVADPHRVIQLMMQGVLERLALAKGAISRRDFEVKSVAISKAQELLIGLQNGLDLSQGKIAEDLYALYDYMKDRLWVASSKLDIDAIDEVVTLMLTIKSGWDQIPEADKQQGFAKRKELGEPK